MLFWVWLHAGQHILPRRALWLADQKVTILKTKKNKCWNRRLAPGDPEVTLTFCKRVSAYFLEMGPWNQPSLWSCTRWISFKLFVGATGDVGEGSPPPGGCRAKGPESVAKYTSACVTMLGHIYVFKWLTHVKGVSCTWATWLSLWVLLLLLAPSSCGWHWQLLLLLTRIDTNISIDILRLTGDWRSMMWRARRNSASGFLIRRT